MFNKLLQDRILNTLENTVKSLSPNNFIMVAGVAFLITFVSIIFFLKKYNCLFCTAPRAYTPENHATKKNTPTMGGIFILLGSAASTVLYAGYLDRRLQGFFLAMGCFGFVGLIDDACKIVYKKGISTLLKAMLQIMAGCAVGFFLLHFKLKPLEIHIPFFDEMDITLSPALFIAWICFVITATCNAVNLTDGLDGLASECIIPNLITALFATTLLSNDSFTTYYQLQKLELDAIFYAISSVIGALFAFLWFNTYPALIMMGDIGSLALGSVLAYFFIILNQEFLLILGGLIFVIETVSVILQVLFFKLTKKRLFKMAPLHHHFELLGLHEARIVKRASLISWACSLCSSFVFLLQFLYKKE
ncbi:phospho-N-acetylmuramoyl-pentapeptide-transferase [bacterium]|nr:MAG: phospho-N-acetylmuramoyl-pentapeptide-transferase [bacterium]QQR61392.1 MAG: phospho-N-acetylmuramoyl-pentapeptide-transferase [bacterium]QQR63087.1 MAG: phospho-N-acetylmuramoyl-pentapeptide-transferase [bacterium]